jgi:LysR family transcriptional regulator, regulator for genes of the gallate degradation pathway
VNWHFKIEPDVRRLRAYLAISDCGSVQRAAAKLNFTQSALSRALKQLECQLGLALFERTRRGMVPTEIGGILKERVRRAIRKRIAEHAKAGTARHPKGFSNKVTRRQLSAFLSIASCRTERGAAEFALSQPAITQALRDLERLVGQALFVRSSRGMIMTLFGKILLLRAKLAFAEIAAAGEDISVRTGGTMRRVAIGVLPYAEASLMAQAVNLVLEHPALQIVLVEGTYRSLIEGLLCGDINLIVGGLNHPAIGGVVRDQLFQDDLVLVVRNGHPLAAEKDLSLADLSGLDWVVPCRGTPARLHFDEVMAAAAIDMGQHPVETDSLLT